MQRRVAVRGIVILDGKILCARLKPYRHADASTYWCTPGGGVEEGDALIPTLEREMIEETGIPPKIGRLLYIQQYVFKGQEQLEFFFKIDNPKDYLNIDLSKTTHDRTDFDLSSHMKVSGKDLQYFDEESKKRFTPFVIESSVGVGRMLLAVLTNAFHEEEINGETRIVLKLDPRIAPVKFAVSPLLKNKQELVVKAKEVYMILKKKYGTVIWDDNGNIGKRYRRSDEIGVPKHITIDFDTLQDGTVTVRDRDTTKQTRVKIEDLTSTD